MGWLPPCRYNAPFTTHRLDVSIRRHLKRQRDQACWDLLRQQSSIVHLHRGLHFLRELPVDLQPVLASVDQTSSSGRIFGLQVDEFVELLHASAAVSEAQRADQAWGELTSPLAWRTSLR